MRLEQRPDGLFQVVRTPEEASRLDADDVFRRISQKPTEPTMPSERVSRERREAVAKSILNTQQTWGRADQVWKAARPDHRANALKYADAALQAALPDREKFYLAVETCIEAGINYGAHESMTKARTIAASKAALIALVYGDDDASGGTR